VATVFQVLKLRKDRTARSEICPECEVPQETPRRGEPLVRGARGDVAFPFPRMI
jgi:hypothetical protein